MTVPSMYAVNENSFYIFAASTKRKIMPRIYSYAADFKRIPILPDEQYHRAASVLIYYKSSSFDESLTRL